MSKFKCCTLYKDQYIYFLKKNYRQTYKMLMNDKKFLVNQIVYAYLYRNGYLCDKSYTKIVDSSDEHFIYFVINFNKLFKKCPYLYNYFCYVLGEKYYNTFIENFSKYMPLEEAC